MNRLLFILFFSLCIYAHKASAQADSLRKSDFVLGTTHKLTSALLGEERLLNVYLPEQYAKDTVTKYPVIYLLDGSANEDFIHITGLVQFLTMIQQIPPCIVVGIANTNRRKDFPHPATFEKHKGLLPESGGSAKFMAYLEKEMQPFIVSRYRTNGQRTLIGQSLGGLLASEILLRKTSLFDNYIIISPSLWWDNESLLQQAAVLLRSQKAAKVKVCIAVGTEGKQMQDDAELLAETLKQAKKGIEVRFIPMPEETHLTILHNSVYKAFELLYPPKKQ